MAKELNEKQRLFLEVLFMDESEGGAGGDFSKAKRLAGYVPNYSTSAIVNRLSAEIEAATRSYFTQVAPRAAMKIKGVLEKPASIGAKQTLAAAKELLDRAGLVRVDKVEVSASGGVFLLPQKDAPSND